jgi:anion-transporting  ArsA/GET3 family ATPase
MHIYVNSPTHLRYKNNFNIYNRPLKFTQRQSGKISLVVVSSLLLSFSFPIYYWLLTLTNNTRYEELHIEYKKKHKIKQTREIQIIEKLEAKTKLLKILQKEKQNYKNTENILMKIYDIRVNYHMKANLLYLLTKDLNKKNVKVESIKYGENNSKILTLNLVSNKDKKITDLLKCLTSKYQDKFHFSLTKISFDERENKYFSKLNVGL